MTKTWWHSLLFACRSESDPS